MSKSIFRWTIPLMTELTKWMHMSHRAVHFIKASLIVLLLLTGWMSLRFSSFQHVGHIFPIVRYGDDGRKAISP
ncbi:MAG: hypothetical protein ACRCW3_00495, partial [Metamycoplasmataceae bacterium]